MKNIKRHIANNVLLSLEIVLLTISFIFLLMGDVRSYLLFFSTGLLAYFFLLMNMILEYLQRVKV